MKFYSSLLLVLIYLNINAQTTFTTLPQYPTETDQITITFDITHQTKTLVGYSGNVYAHTGVYINNDNLTWQNIIGGDHWGNNTVEPLLTNSGQNKYQIVINNPRNYYGVTSSSQKITSLNFVLRSSDASKQTEDIHIPLYSAGISIILNYPTVNLNYGDPMRSPVFVSSGSTLPISVSTTVSGTTSLFINGNQASQSITNSLSYNFVANDYSGSRNDIKIVAADNANHRDSTQFVIFKNPTIKDLPLPPGNQIGVNYQDGNVILALYAPYKKYVYVINNLNDWKVDTTFFMNKYVPNSSKPDSVIWWLQMPSSLADPSGEIAYQFLIDGSLRVQDPYAEKILDPWNDSDPELQKVYPNLLPYPIGKTEGIISVYSPMEEQYNWKVPTFVRPAKDKLVIYELLIRDFISTHSYTTLKDTLSYFKKLGVNAIELMPINEFEGNSSWGYNPMMYFAPDKYYGTKTQLKDFIDACHQYGIAVIMDIVLNHSYGLSPMVRMYWDSTNSRPAANSPWFNTVSPNPVYSWGYDFNHVSPATKYFVDRVTSFWLTEYKMDGFRFDFTKGFTNRPGDGFAIDASRIAILERMANQIWQVSSDAYVILEHFTENSEEIVLSNYGMMIWGNLNYNYSQATMGLANGWDLVNIYYMYLGWSNPYLVGYMESHDEERLMYKNITTGGSNGSYDIKQLTTALDRIKLAAVFFITVPGPKMIWMGGEVGYDVSINDGGRVSEKPFKWNYYSDDTHKKLFNVFAGLIRLKKIYPVFSSSNFFMSSYNSGKIIHLTDNTMSLTILGNFDVTSQNIVPNFQSTGKWYEYFSGDTLDVSDVSAQINLQPGEYRLYTTVKLPSQDFLVDVKEQEKLPTQFKFEQNYPNPFNPTTVISYQLPIDSYVSLKVYDILGREVATIVNEYQLAGSYKTQFSASNLRLASGVYFYRIVADDFVQSKKMLLLK